MKNVHLNEEEKNKLLKVSTLANSFSDSRKLLHGNMG